MQTVTLKINDAYFDSFMSFLQMLPKKAVQLETSTKLLEAKKIKRITKEAMNDVVLKQSTIIRVIK